jgi:hypothetical protein
LGQGLELLGSISLNSRSSNRQKMLRELEFKTTPHLASRAYILQVIEEPRPNNLFMTYIPHP